MAFRNIVVSILCTRNPQIQQSILPKSRFLQIHLTDKHFLRYKKHLVEKPKMAAKSKKAQPPWKAPEGTEIPKLKLYNSLTRQKEEFVPQKGKRVLWYSCGPTVYDAAHMGHARSYMAFDIVRRVLQDYFDYDVFYCMNITDIDDKIIKRARQNYLWEKYVADGNNLSKVKEDVLEAMESFQKKLENETDPLKKDMLTKIRLKVLTAMQEIDKMENNSEQLKDESQAKKVLLDGSKDVMCEMLDNKHGSEVTDNSIFSKLPQYFEEDYHKDMESLNVLPADVLTRVSEYIPEIITYVQKIIGNGYGYESNGSVYFDTVVFDAAENHSYAKIVPEAYGDNRALNEGEGELSISEDRLGEKKNVTDFAVWKASKPGEPSWDSPWGKGRPGWHIECSVMASSILGESLDIHTGGSDLKFPHHDNEIAQAEAYYENDHWVRYFLHAGHLTIDGCKMSKSLKNFISIKDALKTHTSRQLRLLFLLHTWTNPLDYGENSMEVALKYEKLMNEFFLTVKNLLRSVPSTGIDAFEKWSDEELKLNERFLETKQGVHAALCDSINTRTAMDEMRDLIFNCNIYIKNNNTAGRPHNKMLLKNIALFMMKMLKVFGALEQSDEIGFPLQNAESVNVEEMVMPYLTAFAEFRDDVRKIAREQKFIDILKECDKVRDQTLPDLGVRLEDGLTPTAAIKVVGKEAIMKEREEKRQAEEGIRLAKEKQKQEKAKQDAEREAQDKINPAEMFKEETTKYSKFDDKGIPTHDAEGNELQKSVLKKLSKQYFTQEKRYKKYLARQQQNTDGATGNSQ